MKPYGHPILAISAACEWGCCFRTKAPIGYACKGRKPFDRAARKRARRLGREEIAKALVED
jgi:hypothetical protein